MDLVDALACNTTATSPVELSLNPAFQREHPSVYDAIDNYVQTQNDPDAQTPSDPATLRRIREQAVRALVVATLLPPQSRPFHLFGLDVTSISRPFATTIEDRTFTHQPNAIGGNKPITIGHAYSTLAYLPEQTDTHWAPPFSIRRIASDTTDRHVGATQVKDVVTDPGLPLHNQLCVTAADCKYSARLFVAEVAPIKNHILIARSAGNRVFFQQPPPLPEGAPKPAHRPKTYGERFDLKDPDTWREPNTTTQVTAITKKGKQLTYSIQCWDDMLMRSRDGINMHHHPFRLIRVNCFDSNGVLIFKRPMWLIVLGKRRNELSLIHIVEAYRQRYDVEHFFRFGKQKLLMNAIQTPSVKREENWMQIVQLAYIQLWAARELAEQVPYPWERYLPTKNGATASPSTTQRDFGRLIQQVGTPAKSPKPRGKSPGRPKGQTQPARKRQAVIKKSKTTTQKT